MVTNSLNVINRVLNLNDEGENIIKGKIKFGIHNGTLSLFINGQKINFNNADFKIIGYFDPTKKTEQLILEYYK